MMSSCNSRLFEVMTAAFAHAARNTYLQPLQVGSDFLLKESNFGSYQLQMPLPLSLAHAWHAPLHSQVEDLARMRVSVPPHAVIAAGSTSTFCTASLGA